MSDPTFPSYINLGGDLVFQQPYQSNDTTLYGFLVKSDSLATLRSLCDRALNSHPDRRYDYIPLTPYFMIAFASLVGKPTNNPDSQKGWSGERNVGVWVLTAVARRGPVPVIERLAWFMPYMFVDNQFSWAAGREVYGFPKSHGQFQMPDDVSQTDYFKVETLGWETYGPDQWAKVQPVLEARRVGTRSLDAPATSEPWSSAREGYQALIQQMLGGQSEIAVPGLALLFNVIEYIAKEEVPMVFLKQFRDVADGARARYQAIIEAPSNVVGLPKLGLLHGDYELLVHHLDSHPIDTDLGVVAAPQPIKPIASFWGKFDFVLQNGKEIQVWEPQPQGCVGGGSRVGAMIQALLGRGKG